MLNQSCFRQIDSWAVCIRSYTHRPATLLINFDFSDSVDHSKIMLFKSTLRYDWWKSEKTSSDIYMLVWHGLVWPWMARFGTAWLGLVWYSIVVYQVLTFYYGLNWSNVYCAVVSKATLILILGTILRTRILTNSFPNMGVTVQYSTVIHFQYHIISITKYPNVLILLQYR